MHYTLIPMGPRGDVRPFVALGRRLQRAGHVVRQKQGVERALTALSEWLV